MSIAIRNFEETDLDAVRSLMEGQAGPSLAKSAYLQPDHIRSAMLADNIFALVAEENQKPNGTTSIFMEQESPQTVVGLLCRLCITDTPSRPEMATTLVHTALESLKGNLQVCFAEIPSKLLWAQAACEQAGFITSGYLPAKFNLEDRWGAVVYMYLTEEARNARRPHPEIISGARDLANEVLKAHGIIEDAETRDDVVAYPTEGNLTIAPIDSTAVSTMVEGLSQPATKIFRFLQGTQTLYHLPATEISYLAAREDGRVIGVIGYAVDPIDRRIQLVEMITLDGEPEGLMVAHLLEQFSGNDALDYWEVLVSAHAPRMQKTFDQLGFVPCAYLPAFGMEHGMRSDAIKMVKLNAGYETDHSELTSSTKKMIMPLTI